MFCLAHDEMLRAAQLALVEDGLESMPDHSEEVAFLGNGGDRLVLARWPDNKVMLCLILTMSGYLLLHCDKRPAPRSWFVDEDFEFADPACFKKMSRRVRHLIKHGLDK